ncbi:aminotransferase class I/II-fold pyridoxal phosphate-dependent enzyme [Ponticoccus sp. SC2-23]|uniref:aminotransferase class I/II-fold pyridoxal phosphate-dependent enzyme n=1 Tax=Alexandriicola marinus TaxID=2081710 RepID=UPI000FD74EA6|nr:aminotransferase class I/II-fold pyridoxal phosphate-dependent enzyme [Alexandriicola marinus]MBM1220563.1 aminotransferase class I/II-fold pyridoxal phosphate-dependent enzyme [Ponticoccus sp. SC6-9]MBM1225249.1 aminotransferase class I/II-fold pyridoxal phosphate-dependent enzyme [Ponticoccus sp. SC6-15]MBM1228763.1 aminotransferase class I/II-fold pyridoxal phosphate-dependent enzyme [Ponticoccus sp. SC6-38]MBM1233600.1 aminotransferase class I/II-fold pyridoxal phosphate-dependent enzyme
MNYPERFSDLPEHTWPRLRGLLDVHQPGADPIVLTIGEPKHAYPDWLGDALAESLAGFGKYPPNNGSDALLDAITGWIGRRYGVELAADNILALNGTREGLYNAAMALCPEHKNGARPVVLMPNPFYSVYAVAALSVGAEPVYVNATEETGHLPDLTALDGDVLDRTTLAYICSPANPQGSVADMEYWKTALSLAERHDFTILADECYSEIWRDAPPVGVLQAAAEVGADPERVLTFHSLSKRSNLPGLRSGFVAGGAGAIARMRQLRAYAGAPLPLPLQDVSAKVWADEDHVTESRALYHQKYQLADRIFDAVPGYRSPKAGFFLWLPVEDDEQAALRLWTETGVKVLPGSYLSADTAEGNPGKKYIRVAMVAPTQQMQEGLKRLRTCLYD